jgi:hypothetical protein
MLNILSGLTADGGEGKKVPDAPEPLEIQVARRIMGAAAEPARRSRRATIFCIILRRNNSSGRMRPCAGIEQDMP